MRVKIRFYTELARLFDKEISVEIEKEKTVKEVLEEILKTKKLKFSDIYRDYFILVNGKVSKPEVKVKNDDEIHVLPMIMGGICR
ncbi:MAG: MoaD/ThiS family protein [Candidatus Asgardarchaeia archaeon]